MLNQSWVELQRTYAHAAQEYLRALTLENHMESPGQATQRKITLASFDQIAEFVPEFQHFNELLIQDLSYKPRLQVCPDNLLVFSKEKLEVENHFGIQLNKVRPFWALEYASKSNERKDYERNIDVYERLQIPYYLIFSLEARELLLYRLTAAGKYGLVRPDAHDLHWLPELGVGVTVYQRWVRYWWRGRMLPLTGEIARQVQAQQAALTEKEQTITAQKTVLTEKEQLINAQKNVLIEKETTITAQKNALTEKERQIADLLATLARLQGQTPA
jgi:Uma2 family endonuclease